MFDFNIALQSLIGLTVFLVLLFFFLLGYTFWTRKKKQYWQRYEQKFRDYFFSILLDYAEGNDSQLSPDKIIKKISKRSKDYSFFITLLNELDDILDGTERERLNDLIGHPVFAEFYRDKLFEFSTDSKIYACIYFQKSGNINSRVLAKLVHVSKSHNLKLAFAATKALQTANEWTVRKSALQRFLKRNDISELMVAELLHLLDSGLVKDRENVSNILKDLLLKNIDPHSKHIIVRYLGYQQYYECSEFLYQYLKRIHFSKEKISLIRGLILALGELHYPNAAPIIRSYAQEGNKLSIRLAGIQALSALGGKENMAFLLQHMLTAKFPIRKAIIHEFINNDRDRLKLMAQFVTETLQSLKQMDTTNTTHDDFNSYLDKILDISTGIKIALNHRLNESYA